VRFWERKEGDCRSLEKVGGEIALPDKGREGEKVSRPGGESREKSRKRGGRRVQKKTDQKRPNKKKFKDLKP